MKTLVPLALAVVLGLVAMIFARKLGSAPEQAAAPVSNQGMVVVARHDVTPGIELTEEMLKVVGFTADAIPENAFHSTKDVIGRISASTIVKGQAVLDNALAPTGAAAGLQALIPDGMRAITIDINEVTGIAGMITPGSHVDVLASMQNDQGGGMIARTVVQNVLIRAIGQRTAVQKTPGAEPEVFRSVTMLVNPKQSEAIELAASTGRPRLVLRSQSDKAIVDSNGVTVADLRGKGSSVAGTETDPFVSTNDKPGSTTKPSTGDNAGAFSKAPARGSRTIKIIRGGIESESVVPTSRKPQVPVVAETATESATPNK